MGAGWKPSVGRAIPSWDVDPPVGAPESARARLRRRVGRVVDRGQRRDQRRVLGAKRCWTGPRVRRRTRHPGARLVVLCQVVQIDPTIQ